MRGLVEDNVDEGCPSVQKFGIWFGGLGWCWWFSEFVVSLWEDDDFFAKHLVIKSIMI